MKMSSSARSNAKWTLEETLEIVKHLKNGLKLNEIAEKQSRSVNSIQSKIYDIIWNLYSEDQTSEAISKELNLGHNYVLSIIDKCIKENAKKNALSDYNKLLYESNLRIEALLTKLIELNVTKKIN
jgi:hypothetical protein